MKCLLIAALVALLSPNSVIPAKILAVNTFNSSSHSSWLSAMVTALGERGHEVTFVNYSPPKKPIRNAETLIIEPFPPDVQAYEDRFVEMAMRGSALEKVEAFQDTEQKKCERYYEMAPFKQLVSPGFRKTFDLVLLNYNLQDCLLGLAGRFNAAVVLAAPFSSNPHWVYRAMSMATFHAVPHYFDRFTAPLSTYERLQTLVTYLYDDYRYRWVFVPGVDAALKRAFGNDFPGVFKLLERVPLALVNIPASSYNIPLPANVVPVGGLHISPPKALPKDLQEFLDGAKDGAVLMSFGSVVRGDSIAPEKRAAILKAFAKIPQRVLWKWESAGQGEESNVPENVRLYPWLPQTDILAHPNTRLFISHCGGLSSLESYYYGVPILAMPFFLDQLVSADRVVTEGRGLRLDIDDVTEESFSKTLTELLNNSKYQKMASSSKLSLLEEPIPSLDKAVFWIEFAARHREAPHMRSPLADLSSNYALLIDVVLLFSLALMSVFVLYSAFLCAARRFKRQLFASNPKSKESYTKKNR